MIDKTHVLQLVLSHFTVVRVVNGVYYCICPGHSDNKPSLHISMGDIKIILDCKAKCNYKKILDKIGMKPEELYYDYYDKNRKQGNRMSPKQYGYEKIVSTNIHILEWTMDSRRISNTRCQVNAIHKDITIMANGLVR